MFNDATLAALDYIRISMLPLENDRNRMMCNLSASQRARYTEQ